MLPLSNDSPPPSTDPLHPPADPTIPSREPGDSYTFPAYVGGMGKHSIDLGVTTIHLQSDDEHIIADSLVLEEVEKMKFCI